MRGFVADAEAFSDFPRAEPFDVFELEGARVALGELIEGKLHESDELVASANGLRLARNHQQIRANRDVGPAPALFPIPDRRRGEPIARGEPGLRQADAQTDGLDVDGVGDVRLEPLGMRLTSPNYSWRRVKRMVSLD